MNSRNEMESSVVLAILDCIILVAGVGVGFLTIMTYVGGFLAGPIASFLQSNFFETIVAIFLTVLGVTILVLALREK
jgi:putative Mn2+ efflux pump MntP